MSNRHEQNVVPGLGTAFSNLPGEKPSVKLKPQHLVDDHPLVLDHLAKNEDGYTQDHEAAERNRHAERACREVGD